MISKSKYLIIDLLVVIFSLNCICAQESNSKDNKNRFKRLAFFDYRGTNAIDAAIGTSFISGDIPDSEFTFYFKVGYKYYIKEHLNVNFTYHNYNIAFGDSYNEKFMSFDLNFEYVVMPYSKFSPFIQVGYGYNVKTHSEIRSAKAQGSFGVEYIVLEGLGLKLFGEYNYVFTDELDGLIVGRINYTLFRMGFGINLYFGGNKRKQRLWNKIDTVIKSNLVK